MSRPDREKVLRGFALAVFAFLIAAFVGWIYEEICVYLLYHTFYKRGMLHLTICPIYGFGAWGLYLLLHKVKNSAVFFLLSVLAASAFEYACALLLETLFHRIYWTYEGWPLSVHNRISLVSSLIFGVFALIFAKCTVPPLKKAVSRGSAVLWFGVALLAAGTVLADFVLVMKGMQN
ncbi:MAG: putative ABC transporter permease [Oscillospiraceae bacterium]|nr:putative ABC transporter permease [Oscillospiraceae bacterium]